METEVDISKNIARELGYSCRVQPHGMGALLVGPDDEQLMIRWGSPAYAGSLLIIGRLGPTTANPRITLAISKGSQAILNEVRRRLLPEYLRKLSAIRAEHLARAARREAYEELVRIHGRRHLAITGEKEHLFWSSAPGIIGTIELDNTGLTGDVILSDVPFSTINAILVLLHNIGEASETGGIPIQGEK